MLEWIDVRNEVPPAMADVFFLIYIPPLRRNDEDSGYRVVIGWNESIYPEQAPSYCSYQDFDDEDLIGWMNFIKPNWKK